MYGLLARAHLQLQALGCGNAGEFAPQPFAERPDPEIGELRLDGTGLELADVEQRTEQPRHRADRLLLLGQRLERARLVRDAPQDAVQERERLQRLAQIVA